MEFMKHFNQVWNNVEQFQNIFKFYKAKLQNKNKFIFEKQINKMGYTFTNLQFLLTNENKWQKWMTWSYRIGAIANVCNQWRRKGLRGLCQT